MNVPLPFIARPVGIGQALAAVISALFGGAQCPICQQRATALDRALTFVPFGGVK